MKRANKNFLLAEYERYRKKPQSVHINNREIIIPCEYTLGGNAPEVVRKNFLYDYFDLQKREADKYKKAGVAPRLIEFGGVHYIVPFNCRRREIPDTKIVENILRRCEAKYNRAVSLTRKLDKAFPKREYTVELGAEHVSDMQKAYRAFLLKKYKNRTEAAFVRAGEFIAAGARFATQKTLGLLPEHVNGMVKKSLLGFALTAATTTVGYGTYKAFEKASDKTVTEKEQQMPEILPQAEKPTADFTVGVQQSAPIKTETSAQTAARLQDEPSAAKKSASPEKIAPAKTVSISVAKNFRRSETEKNALFKTYIRHVFKNEGGYADETKIDQKTNMGIIQKTLDNFVANNPQTAKAYKFPKTVKELKRSQAEIIYKRDYFDHYKIGDYRNQSIGLMMLDMYVNHTPKTVKRFVQQAAKAAIKAGAEELKVPRTPEEFVTAANSLAHTPEYEGVFYKQLCLERNHHMGVTTKKDKRIAHLTEGLLNRSHSFGDKFVSTQQQEACSSRLALNQKTR